MSLIPCLLSHVSYPMYLIPCLLSHVSYPMSLIPCILYHVSYPMSLAPCLLSHVSCPCLSSLVPHISSSRILSLAILFLLSFSYLLSFVSGYIYGDIGTTVVTVCPIRRGGEVWTIDEVSGWSVDIASLGGGDTWGDVRDNLFLKRFGAMMPFIFVYFDVITYIHSITFIINPSRFLSISASLVSSVRKTSQGRGAEPRIELGPA